MSCTRRKEVEPTETSEYLKSVIARVEKASKDADTLAVKIRELGEEIHSDIDKLKQTKKKVAKEHLAINDYPITLHTLEYAKLLGRCIFNNIVGAITHKMQNSGTQTLTNILDSSYRVDYEYILYAENHTTGAGEALFGFSTLQGLIDLLLIPSQLINHEMYYHLGKYIAEMKCGTDIRLSILRYAGDIRSSSNGTHYEHLGFIEKGVDVSHCVEWAVSKRGIAIMDFDTMRCEKITGYASQFFRTTKPVYFPTGLCNLENGLLEAVYSAKIMQI